jgi:hypothetical protein
MQHYHDEYCLEGLKNLFTHIEFNMRKVQLTDEDR